LPSATTAEGGESMYIGGGLLAVILIIVLLIWLL
jgi:flagellar biogenesis protein FliO